MIIISPRMQKWWVATVPPRALRFKRPLHRCNACNPERDAKAELNRRNQICEVLAGTGVRVAKWNPVLELHQPLRLCRPPPELIGQRDKIHMCGRLLIVSPVRWLFIENNDPHSRRNWSGSRESHPDRLRHRERCY